MKSEIFNAIKGKKAIRLQSDYYCMFGRELAIWIDGKGLNDYKGGCYGIEAFEKPSNRAYLTGAYPHRTRYSHHSFTVKELEVFQLNLNTDKIVWAFAMYQSGSEPMWGFTFLLD